MSKDGNSDCVYASQRIIVQNALCRLIPAGNVWRRSRKFRRGKKDKKLQAEPHSSRPTAGSSLNLEPEFKLNKEDLESWKVIGSGHEANGIYLLDTPGQCFDQPRNAAFGSTSSMSASRIMLSHCRLGHLPFFALSHLFPELFKGISVSSLNCESC